jgi:hypothetical protein
MTIELNGRYLLSLNGGASTEEYRVLEIAPNEEWVRLGRDGAASQWIAMSKVVVRATLEPEAPASVELRG